MVQSKQITIQQARGLSRGYIQPEPCHSFIRGLEDPCHAFALPLPLWGNAGHDSSITCETAGGHKGGSEKSKQPQVLMEFSVDSPKNRLNMIEIR